MKILVTGANGYISTRLLPVLLEDGQELVCMVQGLVLPGLPVVVASLCR